MISIGLGDKVISVTIGSSDNGTMMHELSVLEAEFVRDAIALAIRTKLSEAERDGES